MAVCVNRDTVWILHHKGWTVSEISKETGYPVKLVKAEIKTRWAFDMEAPKGADIGRDKHEDRRGGADKSDKPSQ